MIPSDHKGLPKDFWGSKVVEATVPVQHMQPDLNLGLSLMLLPYTLPPHSIQP